MENDVGHVSYWARMYADVAEMKKIDAQLAGMLCENGMRAHRGESLAYTEDDFADVAKGYDWIIEDLRRIQDAAKN